MRALVYHAYGPPDVLSVQEIPIPEPGPGEVRIRVKAVSLNASDCEFLRAKPVYVRTWGLTRPRFEVLGSDIAGVVEALGKDVTEFREGDEVFGDVLYRWGGFAEFVCAPVNALLKKPAGLSFEQVAAIPQASTVALQGHNWKRPLARGERVLVNGAGGSAGTFALQLARRLGAAEVIGVDHTSKLERMKELGATRVVDYTQEDYTRVAGPCDRILDLVGSRSLLSARSALSENGIYTIVGGPMGRIIAAAFLGPLLSAVSGKKTGMLMHKQNASDIGHMVRLCETGEVSVVIDRTYPLEQGAEAFRQLCEGRVFGKVVVTV